VIIRYVILSPSEAARQAFLGSLFGTFELSPRGHGEKVSLNVEGGGLELVGTGAAGRLKDLTLKLLEGGVQVDGILFLLPAGDHASRSEVEAVSKWVRSNSPSIPVLSRDFNTPSDLDKEIARTSLLALVSKQDQELASG